MNFAMKVFILALGQSSMMAQCFTGLMQRRTTSYNLLASSTTKILFSASDRRAFSSKKDIAKIDSRRRPQIRKKRLGTNDGKKTFTFKLIEPSVVFSNNHILLVNKPAGYHSQPNESLSTATSKKCLLTKLKQMRLGGGSANDFLLPMHRLDQPCTGILLLAKTSKAGTRTGNAFRGHHIVKDYFCVVNGDLEKMKQRSQRNENKHKVSGIMKNKNESPQNGSVIFTPIQDQKMKGGNERVCHLEWEHILTVSSENNVHLIRVQTGTGAKHQVRAMLAQIVKSPICGDIRYGAKVALPDQSVALHGRSLMLPTVKLGDLDFKTTKFIAPIPQTWSTYFSITEEMIKKNGY